MPSMPHDDYQAQDDLRTLTRAHEITTDPKRHGAVKKHARKQMTLTKHVLGGKSPIRGKR